MFLRLLSFNLFFLFIFNSIFSLSPLSNLDHIEKGILKNNSAVCTLNNPSEEQLNHLTPPSHSNNKTQKTSNPLRETAHPIENFIPSLPSHSPLKEEKLHSQKRNSIDPMLVFSIVMISLPAIFMILSLIQTITSIIFLFLGLNKNFTIPKGVTPPQHSGYIDSYLENIYSDQDIIMTFDSNTSITWDAEHRILVVPEGESFSILVNGQSVQLQEGVYALSKFPTIYQAYQIQVDFNLPDTQTIVESTTHTIYSDTVIDKSDYTITNDKIQFIEKEVYLSTEDVISQQNKTQFISIEPWHSSTINLPELQSTGLSHQYPVYRQETVNTHTDTLGQIKWTSNQVFYVRINEVWQKSPQNIDGLYEITHHYPYKQEVTLTLPLPESHISFSKSYSFYSHTKITPTDYHYDNESGILTLNHNVYKSNDDGTINLSELSNTFHFPIYSQNYTIGDTTFDTFSLTPITQEKISSNTFRISSQSHFYIRKNGEEWTQTNQSFFTYSLPSTISQPSLSNWSKEELYPTLFDGKSTLLQSNDGQTLITQSPTNTDIYIYQQLGGEWPATPTTILPSGHLNNIKDFKISTDGNTLISVSNLSIKIWTRSNGTWNNSPDTTITSEYTIQQVTMTSNGDTLFVHSSDNKLKIWTQTNNLWNENPTQTFTASNGIQKILISPDNETLFYLSKNQVYFVFRGDNNWSYFKPTTSSRIITDIQLNPEGNKLFFAEQNLRIQAWQKDGNIWPIEPILTLPESNHLMTHMTFSTDRNTLAAVSDNNNIKIWKKTNNSWSQSPITLTGHTDTINQIFFSSDGSKLYSLSTNGILKVWGQTDTAWNTSAELSINCGNDITTISLKNNFLSLSTTQPQVSLINTNHFSSLIDHLHIYEPDPYVSYNISTGQISSYAPKSVVEWNNSIEGQYCDVNISTDSVQSDTLFKMLSLDNDSTQTLFELKKSSDNHLLIEAEGISYLLQALHDGEWLYQTLPLSELDSFSLIHFKGNSYILTNHQLYYRIVPPSGSKNLIDVLESHAWNYFSSDFNVQVNIHPTPAPIDLTLNQEQLTPIDLTLEEIYRFRLSENGTSLYTGNLNNYDINIYQKTGKKWNLNPTTTLTGPSNVIGKILVSSDGNSVFAMSSERIIKIWSKENGTWNTSPVRSFSGNAPFYFSDMFITPDGETLFSTLSNYGLQVWNKNNGVWNTTETATLTGHTNWIDQVISSSDKQTLFTSSNDTTIKIWTKENGTWNTTATATLTGHTNSITNLILSPDEQTLYSASRDGTIKIWSKENDSWNTTATTTLTGHTDGINSLILLPNQHTLVSASNDQTIKIWTKENGTWNTTATATLGGYSAGVFKVVWSDKYQTLYSASWASNTTDIKVWRPIDGSWTEVTQLEQNPSGIYSTLEFSEQQLVSRDNIRLTIWDETKIDSIIKVFGGVPNPNLSTTSIELKEQPLQWTSAQEGLYLKQTLLNDSTWQDNLCQLTKENFHITFSKNESNLLELDSSLGTYKFQQFNEGAWQDTTCDMSEINSFSVNLVQNQVYLITDSSDEYLIVPNTATATLDTLLQSQDWNQIDFQTSSFLELRRTPQPLYEDITVQANTSYQVQTSDTSPTITVSSTQFELIATQENSISPSTDLNPLYSFSKTIIEQSYDLYYKKASSYLFFLIGIGMTIFIAGALFIIFFILISYMRKIKTLRMNNLNKKNMKKSIEAVELQNINQTPLERNPIAKETPMVHLVSTPKKEESPIQQIKKTLPTIDAIQDTAFMIAHILTAKPLHKASCYFA